MPATTAADRIRRLERILVSPHRWVDAQLVVRAPDGETILTIGGLWDRHLGRYIEPTAARPLRPHVVLLQPSQVAMARAVACTTGA